MALISFNKLTTATRFSGNSSDLGVFIRRDGSRTTAISYIFHCSSNLGNQNSFMTSYCKINYSDTTRLVIGANPKLKDGVNHPAKLELLTDNYLDLVD
jgi:hypothetical protein